MPLRNTFKRACSVLLNLNLYTAIAKPPLSGEVSALPTEGFSDEGIIKTPLHTTLHKFHQRKQVFGCHLSQANACQLYILRCISSTNENKFSGVTYPDRGAGRRSAINILKNTKKRIDYMQYENLSFNDICEILTSPFPVEDVYREAAAVTRETKGRLINVRGIVEYTSCCRRNCAYCGLNCHNTKLQRYRMAPEEIIASALEGADAGYKTIVLQGGEDSFFTAELLADIIREIKSQRQVFITLSAGEMSESDYAEIKDSGCDRYLLKHETSDGELYSSLHPGYSIDGRYECLKTLKRLGFETGGGFMIGLPGQTNEIIAGDLLLLKSIPCDMAGIGPFIPHPDTPLKGAESGNTELTRRAVAVARLMMPEINLPATTSLAVLDMEERNKVFSGGANVIMKKITPPKYRALYEIYPVKYGAIKSVAEERQEINALIKSIGKDFD